MNIKKIEKLSSMPLDKVSGTNDWYFSAEWTGDIYEAEEMLQRGKEFEGSTMHLIHYPDGKVFTPFERKKNVYIQRPIWDQGFIAVLTVDFNSKEISIFHVQPSDCSMQRIANLPLSSVKDCYNMHLSLEPLSLYRHGSDGEFELIWPEKVCFQVDASESLVHRDGDVLYFSKWYEDMDYREEICVRSVHTGEVVRQFPGILYDMPDGTWWLM
ncbi:hypothetical protein [Clostridium minihomine]|uniref:hypothetical protein n=1 Tax=Clostridium minihomine TaxID=2045012 RepID=UPI000C767E45|nr:hypothetical protein [Clostridium minihomine]